jgi:hypothetical protein
MAREGIVPLFIVAKRGKREYAAPGHRFSIAPMMDLNDRRLMSDK